MTVELNSTQTECWCWEIGRCCVQIHSWQMQTDKGVDIDTRHAKQIRSGREKWLHWLWIYTAVNVFYLLYLSKRRFPTHVHIHCVFLALFFPLYIHIHYKRIFWTLHLRPLVRWVLISRGWSPRLHWQFPSFRPIPSYTKWRKACSLLTSAENTMHAKRRITIETARH